jgi:hypothetical protein
VALVLRADPPLAEDDFEDDREDDPLVVAVLGSMTTPSLGRAVTTSPVVLWVNSPLSGVRVHECKGG